MKDNGGRKGNKRTGQPTPKISHGQLQGDRRSFDAGSSSYVGQKERSNEPGGLLESRFPGSCCAHRRSRAIVWYGIGGNVPFTQLAMIAMFMTSTSTHRLRYRPGNCCCCCCWCSAESDSCMQNRHLFTSPRPTFILPPRLLAPLFCLPSTLPVLPFSVSLPCALFGSWSLSVLFAIDHGCWSSAVF